MNAKVIITFGIGIGMIVGGYILNRAMNGAYEKDVDEGLDIAVHDKFGEQLKEAREDLCVAKANHRSLQLTEKNIVDDRLLLNDDYQQAVSKIETSKSQIDILKNALKTAETGNSTQVAVGSGDSAVAVSIKDTSKISQLQTDISKLEGEMKAAEVEKSKFLKIEQAKVVKERSPEDLATIAAVKEAEKKLTKVDFERNYYRNQLQEDNVFMDKIREGAYIRHYTPWKQILVAVLYTVPTVIALSHIWYWTVRGVQVYIQLKKGV